MIKAWWKAKRYEWAKSALREMVNQKDKEIYGQIRGIANVIAMKELDAQRINHCSVCPVIAPLKKFADQYFCTQHLPKLGVAA